jgi:hypothetical protein
MAMSNKSIAVLIGCLGFSVLSVVGCGGLLLAGLLTRVVNTPPPVTSQPYRPVKPGQLPTSVDQDAALERHATPPEQARPASAPTPSAPSVPKTPPQGEQEGDASP